MLLQRKKDFIQFMLDADVLRFGSFITKSGRTSPYFVNTGHYRNGAQIDRLGNFYADAVRQICGQDFDAMFGPAYKGIPLVTAAAAALSRNHGIDRPYFFNRKEAKDHGEGGNLVGYHPCDGDRVIIIEDVITAGTAVRETIPILRQCANVTVEHMFISVNRCEVGQHPKQTATMEVQDEFGITVYALVTVIDLYEYLKQQKIYPDVIPAMEQYMQQYCILDAGK